MPTATELRAERADDAAAIHQVLVDAFNGSQEADLVDALRAGGDLGLSLVAEVNSEIVGYVGLPRLKSPLLGLALAPVAVTPKHQRRGIGSLLIRHGIERARDATDEIMFVVGDPGYYTRFGFAVKTAVPFPCRYAGPYFMALWLRDEIRAPSEVIYPDAFNDLA